MPKVRPAPRLVECYHCGEQSSDQQIIYENKSFCCQGCKLVYTLLEENGLTNYYQLNQQSGVSFLQKPKKEFTFLDQEKVLTQLLTFRSATQSIITLHLPQIHCSSCLWLLENLNRLNPGIKRSIVNFPKKTARLFFNENEISLRELVELLDAIGYTPTINYSDLNPKTLQKKDKRLIYQLGLAGFVFGNIMLLSFPEYLGMNSIEDALFIHLFPFINLLLVIPLLIYSGKDYFQSAWQGIKAKRLNIDVPISIGIIALFGRSLFEILMRIGPGYLDALAGLLFFLLLGKWFQQKTYAGLSFERDYKSYFPIAIQKKVGADWESKPLDELAPGDQIRIRNQEIIPVDGILMDEHAVIDYSFVSGEADPIHKKKGETLYAGGRQLGKAVHLKVQRAVDNSYLTRLWNDDAFAKHKSEGEATLLAEKVGKYFTTGILCIAALTLLYWLPQDTGKAFNAFTAVLIVACPCAIALAIPFTFGNVIRVLGRAGLYLKNISVIEKWAQIDTLVFDKTGTLTSKKASQIKWNGPVLKMGEEQFLRSLVVHSTHPLSQLIYKHYAKHSLYALDEFREIEGEGLIGKLDIHNIRLGAKSLMHNTSIIGKGVHLEINGVYKGYFSLESQYRTGLSNVIERLRSYQMTLLTGDNDRERSHLLFYFGTQAAMFFNQQPVDKLNYIKKLQAKGAKVMMIGDGLNDAGALKQSDIGLALSEASGNFTPASDAILEGDQFEKLPIYFKLIKAGNIIVYLAFTLALIYNIIGLSFAVRAALSPVIAAILMPLSSITIVVFGVAASSIVAKYLGVTKITKPTD